MQFKYPEILFFLFLLLIPLLIHLFQLQKFKKEAFTNVQFLKKIDLESRKSSKLKKLLILLSRMLALAALIIAFSQPYINKSDGLQQRKTIIYLDNSMSLQAMGASGIDQLQVNKNMLLDKLNEKDQEISLISNQKFLIDLDPKSLNNELISLDFHPLKKDINQVLLQINGVQKNKTNTLYDIYLISDFQNINNRIDSNLINDLNDYNLVNLSNEKTENISIDTIWIAKKDTDQITLKAHLSSWQMTEKDLSVSLFLNEDLYGKTTVTMLPDSKKEVEFLVPAGILNSGKISLTDHRLNFDNELYFSIPEMKKRNVLIIGTGHHFLERIYKKNEFNLTTTTYADLDQSIIPAQDLIIISELDKISKPLGQSLEVFVKQKGNLVIIPSTDIDIGTYNALLESFQAGRITDKFQEDKSVTGINYDHPFFNQVFEKEVYNFQYPVLSQGYIGDFKNASPLLQFDDLTDFVSEIRYFDNKVYWISSPLSSQENKFVNSPLIVPIFYNFSVQSKNDGAIYLTIGQQNEITIDTGNSDDSPVKIINKDTEFIPMQTKSSEVTKITTQEYPLDQGIYELQSNAKLLQRLAFNYDRIESDLNFNDLSPLADAYENIHLYDSLDKALKEGNDRNNNKDLWHLFIIFALVFLILEILLQKFLKN
ncbi:BatA domain-containing protein [Lutimonas sp.]|uniref:BatA domain-containing protein n=1 Tax=Lutimonas sp. TaxID=1872403 RepID=UPI003C77CBC6